VNACPRRWGRWLFRCQGNPDGRNHECIGDRGHAALHRCGFCGALLMVGLL
jgi:hypothetical protein